MNYKENFEKFFGTEELKRQECLAKLNPTLLRLSAYLGIDPIPVVCEKLNEDSRYYVADNYIAISEDLIENEVEALKCLIHEVRHYYQIICVNHNITREPLLSLWQEELKLDYNNMPVEESMCLGIELDAYAFTKFIMKNWFNVNVIHNDKNYDIALTNYIAKYFL